MGQNGAGMRPPGGQQLDWRQLVQAVQQSNPNIKPDVLAEAVNQFLPMMNAQSQQEWRMVSLQIPRAGAAAARAAVHAGGAGAQHPGVRERGHAA